MIRKLPPSRRFEIMSKCYHAARQIISEPIRAEHSDWSEAEIYKAVSQRWLLLTEADSEAIQDEIERRGWVDAWLAEAVSLEEQTKVRG